MSSDAVKSERHSSASTYHQTCGIYIAENHIYYFILESIKLVVL